MTTVISINGENDMHLDNTNNIALATGQIAVEQAAQTASLAQLEEMILFTTQGMPSFQAVWVGSPNLALYQAALAAAISQIFGVNSVDSLVVSQDGDNLNYTAEISTIYGALTING